jgi:hypothetical protein
VVSARTLLVVYVFPKIEEGNQRGKERPLWPCGASRELPNKESGQAIIILRRTLLVVYVFPKIEEKNIAYY